METIGDAYCVAGGLHKESPTHAVQIALMALEMMDLSDEVTTPMGEVIKVNVSAGFSLFCHSMIINESDAPLCFDLLIFSYFSCKPLLETK